MRLHVALPLIAGLVCLAAGSAMARDAVLGPDAQACSDSASGTSVLVNVWGFKDRKGNVRVELYPATEEDFLASRTKLLAEGKLFKRIDVPTPPDGDAWVCVALPGAGTYALSVLHDRNASGKLDAFSDGFGFPGNPDLKLKKPGVDQATFSADGKAELEIVLQYYKGLFSVGPVRTR